MSAVLAGWHRLPFLGRDESAFEIECEIMKSRTRLGPVSFVVRRVRHRLYAVPARFRV